MKNKFNILIAPLFFALAISISGHPLGNFSINQYSRLEVERSRINIRQILDMAEIPTFQEKSAIDTDKDGTMSGAELNAYAERITPDHLANLFLTVNDQPLEIRSDSKHISLTTGAGDLPTLRIEWNLTADLKNVSEKNQVKFENRNFADRLGWNEIVVKRSGGISIFDSNAFGSGVTDELKEYPQESLNAPLAERTATFSFTTKTIPENARALQNRDGQATAAVQKDRFAELIAVPEITPVIVIFGLILAVGLGALHAMSPGHGKTIVGAYLVGSRGTPKHAMFLGLTVTITHTLSVFALGLIALFASNYILPEKLMPILGFMSGVLVLYIGLTMFKTRLFSFLGWEKVAHHHSHDGHTHSHDGHTHSHDDGHTHLPPEEISWKSLLALGVSGGLLPCPSALVLMLSAISLGRVGYGLILTIAFSFGLAATLTVIGLIFLYVGKAFGGTRLGQSRVFKALPVFSAFVIACLGAVICYQFLG